MAYGYFRATRRFFARETFHARAIALIFREFDPPLGTFTPNGYAKMIRLCGQARMLDQGTPAAIQLCHGSIPVASFGQAIRHCHRTKGPLDEKECEHLALLYNFTDTTHRLQTKLQIIGERVLYQCEVDVRPKISSNISTKA